MPNFRDLTNMRFERLIARETVGKRGNYYYWRCECECGNEIITRGTNLTSGATKSCGCLNIENHRGEKERKLNEFTVSGNTVYVKLSNSSDIMICDLEDWKKLKGFTWLKGKMGYAITQNVVGNEGNRKRNTRKFHIEILGKKKGYVIDHINRNPLDNRKCNLRFITQHANTTNQGIRINNTSGIKGVCKRKDTGKWSAKITIDRKTVSLGCYNTKEDATEARRIAEEKYFKPLFENKED